MMDITGPLPKDGRLQSKDHIQKVHFADFINFQEPFYINRQVSWHPISTHSIYTPWKSILFMQVHWWLYCGFNRGQSQLFCRILLYFNSTYLCTVCIHMWKWACFYIFHLRCRNHWIAYLLMSWAIYIYFAACKTTAIWKHVGTEL